MSGMIRYEWKKIWGSRLTQVSVLGCVLFLLFCIWANIRQVFAVDSQGNMVYGMAAKEILKQTQTRQVLDQETVEEIMGEYLDGAQRIRREIQDPEIASDEIRRTLYLPKSDLHVLIWNAYKEQADDEAETVYQENLGRDFRQARKEENQSYTALLAGSGKITVEEAAWWNERNDGISEYLYGYRKGWEQILDQMGWGILLMMIVCIGTAPVFAGEYQSKCDSLFLCMKYGKSRLAAAKVLTSWLYASVVYVGITMTNCVLVLLVLGTEGWDLPVRLYYPSTPPSYDVTMGQACLLMFLLGYILTLGIMSVTLWMSSIFKNAYGVIVTAFLLLIVPTFLQMSSGGYMLEHILSLLPSNILHFSFTDYTAYSLGKNVVSCLSADLLVNGAAAVLFSIAGYEMFRRHQVNR